MNNISAVIITLNEEHNIAACLKSVSWADEIVVVDSGSTDQTVQIAKKFTNKVIHNDWPGFVNQKNFAVAQAENTWIFSIDSDEICSDSLKDQILLVTSNKPDCRAYLIPRKNFFMGKWLKYGGWYPDHVLRLFKKDAGKFEGVNSLHEKVVIRSGKTGKLPTPLIHKAYNSISQYITKQNRYTSIASKSKKPVPAILIIGKFFSKWIETYIVKKGFLDGFYGLFISIMAAFFCFIKYLKMYSPGDD